MRLLRIILERHARLAAWAAQVEGADLLVGAGVALLMVAGLTGWLSMPLQGSAAGYALSLVRLPEALSSLPKNPLRPFSYGVASIAIALCAAFAARRGGNNGRWLFHIGGAGFLLGATFYVTLVFRHPQVMDAASIQLHERSLIADFSTDVLDGNAGSDPRKMPPGPSGFMERLLAALDLTSVSGVGMGWRLAALGGLLIQGSALWRRRRLGVDGLVLVAVFAGYVAWASVDTLRAEVLLVRGDRRLAEGDFVSAVDLYERAQAIDHTLSSSPDYCHQIGAALYQLGRVDRAERYIYLGDNFASHDDDQTALYQYRAALALRPEMAVAANRAAGALVDLGLVLYRKHNVQSAIVRWEEAAALAPSRIDAHFFLVRALFQVNGTDQTEAIAEGERLLGRVGDQLVRADIYNDLGDCYSRQKDLLRARVMYRRSLASFALVKRVINFNAMTGLQGL